MRLGTGPERMILCSLVTPRPPQLWCRDCPRVGGAVGREATLDSGPILDSVPSVDDWGGVRHWNSGLGNYLQPPGLSTIWWPVSDSSCHYSTAPVLSLILSPELHCPVNRMRQRPGAQSQAYAGTGGRAAW